MPLGSLCRHQELGRHDIYMEPCLVIFNQFLEGRGRGSIFLNSLYIYISIWFHQQHVFLVSRYRNSRAGLCFNASCCIQPVGWMLKDDCSPLYALPLGRMDFLHVLRSRWPTFFQLQLISERLSNSHRAQGLLGRKVDSVDPRVRFAADALM